MLITKVSLVVRDYDEAIAWFSRCLGFELAEDVDMGGGKRWVVVSPPGGSGTGLLLAKAVGERQEAAVGNQAGGRVGFFLKTDNFDGDYARMKEAGVHFREVPRDEPYGKVAVFEDVSGNPWDLIQPAPTATGAP